MDGTGTIGSNTRVLAHRGFHTNGVAENSMGAFRAAVDVGADVLELDVRRTLDGALVIHHDPTFVKGGPKIADLRLAELPLLGDGQRVPLLSEVADLARDRGAKLAVELKEPGYERTVVDVLRSRIGTAQFEITSFTPKSIRAVEALDPSIRTGMLAPRIPGFLRESALYPAAIWMLDKVHWNPALNRAERIGADYVSVDHRMASSQFLADAAVRGLPVDVWTANDALTIQRLYEQGVQGIVTDHPDLALKMRPHPLPAAGRTDGGQARKVA